MIDVEYGIEWQNEYESNFIQCMLFLIAYRAVFCALSSASLHLVSYSIESVITKLFRHFMQLHIKSACSEICGK